MKRRLLELLCCPVCQGTLRLDVFREADEIEEGCLTCVGCARTYPVIGGIPRMLPDELAHLVPGYHPAFFRTHAEAMRSFLGRCRPPQRSAWWRAESRTVKSYSYQWRKFKHMLPEWEETFLHSVYPVTPGFFRGQAGLDAGCGFGRSMFYAASYGAEIIGLDLSEAVEAARENVGHLPTAHVVQGDIFHPPVRDGALDFVYSIGVLHHLPNPREGFLRLAKLLAPGAPIFIWVYSRGRGRQIACFEFVRAISTHLPLRALDGVCWVLAAGHWVLWILPYRFLNRFRVTRALARRIPFTFYAPYPFHVLHSGWVDHLSVPLANYYKQEIVAAWLQEAGLERVVTDKEWGKYGGGRALGHALAPREREVAVNA